MLLTLGAPGSTIKGALMATSNSDRASLLRHQLDRVGVIG
jgi:hypothetical protein